MGGRVVEGSGFENQRRGDSTGGSNPSPSATSSSTALHEAAARFLPVPRYCGHDASPCHFTSTSTPLRVDPAISFLGS